MPPNFVPVNWADPYADFPVERLYEVLATYQLPRNIGESREYSNFGLALLGQALARQAGVDFETLLRDRILEPLGMASTAITLSPALTRRLAAGYDDHLDAVPPWNLNGFAPAGGLHSSANDMLTYLEVASGAKASALSGAIADELRVRRPIWMSTRVQGLGWNIDHWANGELASHGGATAGFQSFAGFDRGRRLGVVVLSNSAYVVEDIGVYALGGPRPYKFAFPPVKPSLRVPVAIDQGRLPAYPGIYSSAPDRKLTVTLEDGRLMIASAGQPKRELIPVGPDEFVVKGFELLITFHRDVDDKVYGLMMSDGDRRVGALREG
jgi:CubicO group peptidase (beta-lactamase class C family)